MGRTGKGTSTSVRNANQEPPQYRYVMPADKKDQDAAKPGQLSSGRAAVSSIMTTLHVSTPRKSSSPTQLIVALQGDPNSPTRDESRYISQPAPMRRLNDRGGMYTKVCVD